MLIWLVVLTILKNISQWEGLSHILWKKCLKPPTSKLIKHLEKINHVWLETMGFVSQQRWQPLQTLNRIGRATCRFWNVPPAAWLLRNARVQCSSARCRARPSLGEHPAGLHHGALSSLLQPFQFSITFWLVVYLPLWKLLVTWDDYSQYMEKIIQMFQTTNQLWRWVVEDFLLRCLRALPAAPRNNRCRAAKPQHGVAVSIAWRTIERWSVPFLDTSVSSGHSDTSQF